MSLYQQAQAHEEKGDSHLDLGTVMLKDVNDYLQRFQDDIAKGVGLASVTVKLKGVSSTIKDGLRQIISATMAQLAASASAISNKQINLNNDIARVNAITEKIDAVMDSIKDIGDETRLLGLKAAIKAAKVIEAAAEGKEAKVVEAAKGAEETKLLEAAKVAEEATVVETDKVAEEATVVETDKVAEEATVVETAKVAEEVETIEVAKTGGAGLQLIDVLIVLGLGVVTHKIRKHLNGSKKK